MQRDHSEFTVASSVQAMLIAALRRGIQPWLGGVVLGGGGRDLSEERWWLAPLDTVASEVVSCGLSSEFCPLLVMPALGLPFPCPFEIEAYVSWFCPCFPVSPAADIWGSGGNSSLPFVGFGAFGSCKATLAVRKSTA